MSYNQVVGLRAVGRSEKQEGADSNMSAIICPIGEKGLTNLLHVLKTEDQYSHSSSSVMYNIKI